MALAMELPADFWLAADSLPAVRQQDHHASGAVRRFGKLDADLIGHGRFPLASSRTRFRRFRPV
jgi:hypothetical protein